MKDPLSKEDIKTWFSKTFTGASLFDLNDIYLYAFN
jgi:hypothetical protein